MVSEIGKNTDSLRLTASSDIFHGSLVVRTPDIHRQSQGGIREALISSTPCELEVVNRDT